MKTTTDKPRIAPRPKPAPKTYASMEDALRTKHEEAKAFFEKYALPE